MHGNAKPMPESYPPGKNRDRIQHFRDSESKAPDKNPDKQAEHHKHGQSQDMPYCLRIPLSEYLIFYDQIPDMPIPVKYLLYFAQAVYLHGGG